MDDNMKKIAQFLSESVSPALREMDALRKQLSEAQQKIADYKTAERYEKIARLLEGKGTFADKSLEERVIALRKLAEEGANLDTLETSAKMMTPDGSIGKLAEVSSAGSGKDGFVATVLTFS